MPIPWSQAEMKERLLAAVIASSSGLNMNEVARIFGKGATYDAVEGQLRKVKRLAAELKEEAKDRSAPTATPSRTKKTKDLADSPIKTPVKSGRVTKPKKPATPKVKVELFEDAGVLFTAAPGKATSEEPMEEFI